MTIALVQGNARATSSTSSINVTLPQTPTNGNVLIACIALRTYGVSVSSVTQQGVTWTRQTSAHNNWGDEQAEIWLGTVGSSALTSITVSLTGTPPYGAIADVCEWSGIATTGFLDQTSSASDSYPGTAASSTGTTATTAQASELWIGCIATANQTQSTPTNGFTLLDGAVYSATGCAYLYKVVSSTGAASSGTTLAGADGWVGCIATFKGSGSGSTIIVSYNGRYAGNGSKQTTLEYNGANNIMQVESNVPNNLDGSAVIETLVIDGLSPEQGRVGILLENVYNCCIRNITIKNCDIGIKVSLTGTNWSHANRFEHIRMENVKTGILFTGISGTKDFSYTTIDDVGISLKNDSGAVGIKIGDPYANLYSSFIKATVWLGTSNGTGMEINGELKLSLVNLEVEEDSSIYTGKGLVVNSGAYEYDNQNFLLACGSIQAANRVSGSGTIESNTPTVKYW